MIAVRALYIAVVAALLGSVGPVRAAQPVLVFAAASVAQAVQAAAKDFTAQTGVAVTVSGAASSALAQQIARGAPAHLYIAAHPRWIAFLAAKDVVDPAHTVALLGNDLVLIAPAARTEPLEPAPGFAVAAALGSDGRLAIGDPTHVPAGLYAKQALETLGVWHTVANRLAPAGDAVAALTFVARGETPLGIVYRTDAALSDAVRIVGTFPAGTHEAIRYDIAAVAGNATTGSEAFLHYLTSNAARDVFERFGFRFLPEA